MCLRIPAYCLPQCGKDLNNIVHHFWTMANIKRLFGDFNQQQGGRGPGWNKPPPPPSPILASAELMMDVVIIIIM